MVACFHETQSKRNNKRGLPDQSCVLPRALEGRSGRTERSKGAQGRIMHQRPANRGALNKPSLRPLPGHRQAFVTAFVTNVDERWLVEISHVSRFARSILSMPGLRHSTKAV